jgi:hypothetical protein
VPCDTAACRVCGIGNRIIDVGYIISAEMAKRVFYRNVKV